jgi:hypothetical protein
MRLAGLVIIALIAGPASALACSQPPNWSIEKEFADASLVFRGLVTATELNPFQIEIDGEKQRPFVDIRYDVKETFKGKPDTGGAISTTSAIMGGCGVPVLAGQDFLFFVKPFDKEFRDQAPEVAERSQGMVSISGTQMLPQYAPRLDEALADVRALSGDKHLPERHE